jgi:hypothetical protein
MSSARRLGASATLHRMKLTVRSALVILLAIQFVGLQWFGALHRTLHAPLSASVNVVTQADSNSHDHAVSTNVPMHDDLLSDAWSDHKNKTDCDRFDACTNGDTLATALPVAQFLPPAACTTTRSYVANILASTRIALARAPPLA